MLGFLGGSCVPFPAAKVQARYAGTGAFLARFGVAARAAEKAGVLPPRDVAALLAEAQDAYQAVADRT